jgi:hypothetical protein
MLKRLCSSCTHVPRVDHGACGLLRQALQEAEPVAANAQAVGAQTSGALGVVRAAYKQVRAMMLDVPVHASMLDGEPGEDDDLFDVVWKQVRGTMLNLTVSAESKVAMAAHVHAYTPLHAVVWVFVAVLDDDE